MQVRGATCKHCLALGTARRIIFKTRRRCQLCNALLPVTRHFNCRRCVATNADHYTLIKMGNGLA